jgi:glutathione S-transferase
MDAPQPSGIMALMIKLFGHARSRASRSLWMLEELGIAYEHVPIRPGTESRAAEYLRINPNGRIPALEDDGLVLWESLAINLYLAERHGSAPLWPSEASGRALALQRLLVSIAGSLAKGAAAGDAEVASLLERLYAAFRVLEAKLEHGYLLGPEFTVADLNLASTLREPGECGVASIPAITLRPFPRIERWLGRCEQRPANRRVADS